MRDRGVYFRPLGDVVVLMPPLTSTSFAAWPPRSTRPSSSGSVPDLLVTGTDTGVGKTVIAAVLLLVLRAHGVGRGLQAGGDRRPGPARLGLHGARPHCGLEAVVVGRAGLGALNHSALTATARQARGVTVRGIVLNGRSALPDVAEQTNPEALARLLPGVLPVVVRRHATTTGTLDLARQAQAAVAGLV
jgi:hypothetical protein